MAQTAEKQCSEAEIQSTASTQEKLASLKTQLDKPECATQLQSLSEQIIKNLTLSEYLKLTPEEQTLLITTPPLTKSSKNGETFTVRFYGNKELENNASLGDLPPYITSVTVTDKKQPSLQGAREGLNGEFYKGNQRLKIFNQTTITINTLISDNDIQKQNTQLTSKLESTNSNDYGISDPNKQSLLTNECFQHAIDVDFALHFFKTIGENFEFTNAGEDFKSQVLMFAKIYGRMKDKFHQKHGNKNINENDGKYSPEFLTFFCKEWARVYQKNKNPIEIYKSIVKKYVPDKEAEYLNKGLKLLAAKESKEKPDDAHREYSIRKARKEDEAILAAIDGKNTREMSDEEFNAVFRSCFNSTCETICNNLATSLGIDPRILKEPFLYIALHEGDLNFGITTTEKNNRTSSNATTFQINHKGNKGAALRNANRLRLIGLEYFKSKSNIELQNSELNDPATKDLLAYIGYLSQKPTVLARFKEIPSMTAQELAAFISNEVQVGISAIGTCVASNYTKGLTIRTNNVKNDQNQETRISHGNYQEYIKSGKLLCIGDSHTLRFNGLSNTKGPVLGYGGKSSKFIKNEILKNDMSSFGNVEVATICMGTNNISSDTPESIRQDTLEVIAHINEKCSNIKKIIILTPPPAEFGSQETKDKLLALNQQLLNISVPKITTIDLYSNLATDNGNFKPEYQSTYRDRETGKTKRDRIHFNNKGSQLVRNLILSKTQETTNLTARN